MSESTSGGTSGAEPTESVDPIESVENALRDVAKGAWWLLLIRGILAVLFGVFAFTTPLLTAFAVVIVYGAFAIVDGVVSIVHGIRNSRVKRPWGWLVFNGVVGILAGLVALIFPFTFGLLAGLFIAYVIAFAAIFQGVSGLAAGYSVAGSRALGITYGVIGIVFGIALIVVTFVVPPDSTLISLIWVAGFWAVLEGIVLMVLAFRVRSAVK